jgi:hypothetical protein
VPVAAVRSGAMAVDGGAVEDETGRRAELEYLVEFRVPSAVKHIVGLSWSGNGGEAGFVTSPTHHVLRDSASNSKNPIDASTPSRRQCRALARGSTISS